VLLFWLDFLQLWLECVAPLVCFCFVLFVLGSQRFVNRQVCLSHLGEVCYKWILSPLGGTLHTG
jgi:hypothetical protein